MSLSDLMSHAGLVSYAEIGLVISMAAFALVGLSLLLRRNRAVWDAAARLPLEEGAGDAIAKLNSEPKGTGHE